MIKRAIIKSNQWYDNLPEGKRFAFFLGVIMSTLLVAQYFMLSRNSIWAFPIWVCIFCFWRIGYVFFDWRDWYKNRGLETTASIKEEFKAIVIAENIQTYNAVPHTKIKSEKTPNELLLSLMEISHKKERQTVDGLTGKGLFIDLLTDHLAKNSEAEMSHVLNTIVRETKSKKAKLSK